MADIIGIADESSMQENSSEIHSLWLLPGGDENLALGHYVRMSRNLMYHVCGEGCYPYRRQQTDKSAGNPAMAMRRICALLTTASSIRLRATCFLMMFFKTMMSASPTRMCSFSPIPRSTKQRFVSAGIGRSDTMSPEKATLQLSRDRDSSVCADTIR